MKKINTEDTKKKYFKILEGLISSYNKVKTKDEFRKVMQKSSKYIKKMQDENPKVLNELYNVTVALVNAQQDAIFRLTGKRHMQV
jgi:hypothetical protein